MGMLGVQLEGFCITTPPIILLPLCTNDCINGSTKASECRLASFSMRERISSIMVFRSFSANPSGLVFSYSVSLSSSQVGLLIKSAVFWISSVV